MSKKLEKILDKKHQKFINGMDKLISDISTIDKDESYKVILLKKEFEKVINDFNSMNNTWDKYLDCIERSKL